MGISYQKKRQTPKRKAVGSNPARDARLNAENHWLNSDKEVNYLSTVS